MNTASGNPPVADDRAPRPDPFEDAGGRQQRLWRSILRGRYVAIVVLVVASVLGREELGDQRWFLLVLIGAAGLAYNAVFDVLLRRRGRLAPAMAFTDQLAFVGLLAAFSELLAPVLLLLVTLNATSGAAFGGTVARRSAALGAVLATPVALLSSDDLVLSIALLLAYLVASAFAVVVVSTVSEIERDVRRRYGELMGGIDAVVWEQLTRRPSTLYVNQRAEEILGDPVEAWEQPGHWRERVHPDDVERAAREYRDAIRRGRNRELEYRMVAADGRVVHVKDRMRVEVDDLGRPVHVRGVMLDMTDEKRAEAEAVQYLNLVDRIALALFVLRLDQEGRSDRTDALPVRDSDAGAALRCAALNPEAARLSGVDLHRAVDRPAGEVLPFANERVLSELARVARTGRNLTFDDVRVQPPNSGIRTYSAYAFPLPDAAVGVAMHDVTDRTTAAEVLRRQALHDALTGLPNRSMLLERLRFTIQRAAGAGSAALLVMDLNQFKEVNDTLGHEHGDRLLIELSRRLRRVVRDVDTIARLGGDEFAVLIDGGGAEEARRTAEVIREALEQPFHLGGIDIQTSAAVGIALHPEHGLDAEQLVQRADVAMYLAKRGSATFAIYDPAHDQSSIRRLSLLGELRRAIDLDELELHYQPTLDLRTGHVPGAEALVRWQHPEHGLVPPGEFIELAELSGLIQPLTRWVLTAGVRQTRQWAEREQPLTVSINLSARNLYETELVTWIEELLHREQVDPTLVKIELTESQLMDDPLQAMEVLEAIQALGATTSIDDFGTGHSSLAYLKHLPIDELKIDRSFVGNMTQDDSDLMIVRSTIDLAHNLGLTVLAEGVEDGDTLAHLAELGCDRAQGYFITEPMPSEEATTWLADDDSLSHVHPHLKLVPPAATLWSDHE